MPKVPTTNSQPKALDTLTGIVELVLSFRYADKTPSLVDIGRAVIAASRAMHIKDLDERLSVENAAVLALAKKRQLVS
jgi:hypothetical protein